MELNCLNFISRSTGGPRTTISVKSDVDDKSCLVSSFDCVYEYVCVCSVSFSRIYFLIGLWAVE